MSACSHEAGSCHCGRGCGCEVGNVFAGVSSPEAGGDGHGHGHTHDHGSGATDGGEEPLPFWRGEAFFLGVCAAVFAGLMVGGTALSGVVGVWGVRALFGVLYLACGLSVLRDGWRAIRSGDPFNEFTLMGGATLVALALGEWPEAVGVMLFYRVGEYFQEKASANSRKSIRNLLAGKPTLAHRVEGDDIVTRPVEDIVPGDRVVVRVGEKIPLDGVVRAGESQVDQSPLTGESVPVRVAPGDDALGGTVNLGSVLTIEATRAFADTHMARVLQLVEHAAANKSPVERFITRFARYYTPAVVAVAALVAVLPPLAAGLPWNVWIYRALVLLMVSCPCALVISIPLGYFGGIGLASRRGILVKGGYVFDALSHVDRVVFDKTGTLTRGVFDVTRIEPADGATEDGLLRAAAVAEADSNHPVAKAVQRRIAERGWALPMRESSREAAGKGMIVRAEGVEWLAGTARLLSDHGVEAPAVESAGTVVHVARDGRYLGWVGVSDVLRPESADTVTALHARGMKTLMLTGDRRGAATEVAAAVGVSDYKAELLPEDKASALGGQAERDRTMFVGDGINDAPVLAMSRVGVAMGGVGAEAAIEAADVVILNDSPANVPELFRIGGRVRSVVWQNIVLAMGVKGLFMVLGVLGLSGLWEAVFADVGVALLALGNALRGVRR